MDLNELVDDVVRDFPEALESEVKRSVVRAATTFFRDSQVWRHSETFDVQQGAKEFFPALPFDTVVAYSVTVLFTDSVGRESKLTPVNKHELRNKVTGAPTCFYSDRDSLEIDGGGATGSLTVETVIVPTRSITEIPDEIADVWFDALRAGTVTFMHAMPNKTWSDSRLAELNMRLFEDDIIKAKRLARGDLNKPRRVAKFNPGFRL